MAERERQVGEFRSARARIFLSGIALALIMALVPLGARADTAAETGITITTTDAGTFSIAFAGSGAFAFSAQSGASSVGVSAVSGATARTTLELVWNDTRLDDARGPYSIAISAGDLTSNVARGDGDGVYSIRAGNLWAVAVNGTELDQAVSLDQPATVFTSAPTPVAGEQRLAVVVDLTVPPGSYPTSYASVFTVQVTHSADRL